MIAEFGGSQSDEGDFDDVELDSRPEGSAVGLDELEVPGRKAKRKQNAKDGSLSSLRKELAEARNAKKPKNEDSAPLASGKTSQTFCIQNPRSNLHKVEESSAAGDH